MTTQHTSAPWVINPYKAKYELVTTLAPDNVEKRNMMLAISGKNKFEAISIGTTQGQVAIIPLDESSVENAAHIVKCVNLHDSLVSILQEIIGAPPEGWTLIDAVNLLEKARALLAKARAS